MSDFLVIGAGIQGEAIVYDLLHNASARNNVVLIDPNLSNLETVSEKVGRDRLKTVQVDASYEGKAAVHMKGVDAVISAAPYDLNYGFAEAAVVSGKHFVDLGGNNDIVEKQFSLDSLARKMGSKVVPDCGIAPGAVSILVKRGIENIGIPDYVKIRVGGLPQYPQGPLNYMKVFSVHGLVNEYIMPTEVLRRGRRRLVESMTGIEKLYFAELGEMEAAYTSGGSSTLSKTFEGVIQELDYKTIRFPGHFRIVHDWWKNGLFADTPCPDGRMMRQKTEAMIEEMIDYKGLDMMVMRIEMGRDVGTENARKLTYEMINRYDTNLEHSAMQRTTGYSASIIAQMLVNNMIKDTGVLYQERSVPADEFVRQWKKRGILLEQY
ncbi:MAG: saccharopine dehydrogenase C-terminal domain-containing protein [Candidatus Woesearchaeota archaeon]